MCSQVRNKPLQKPWLERQFSTAGEGINNPQTQTLGERPMHSLIKTALIAAVGAAVVTASPAFAAKAKRDWRPLGFQESFTYAPSATTVVPGTSQITAEYLKDGPIHNGNAY